MNILLVTHGSRGDVQPFAALARELTDTGCSVTMAAPSASAWLGEPYCERMVNLHDGPNVLADDLDVVRSLERKFKGFSGKADLLRTTRKTRRVVRCFLDDIADMIVEDRRLGIKYDLLVYHVSVPGHYVADYLGIPSVVMCPQAYWVPTSAFPDPSYPFRVPRALNRATYFASPLVLWAFAGGVGRWRRQRLGLGPRMKSKLRQWDGSRSTVLYSFSERLLPQGTWYPSWVHVTGFWDLPLSDGWVAPESLREFLDDGAPPVYIGFASSVMSEPRRIGEIVGEAVRKAGARAVVVGGWSGLKEEDLGPEVTFLHEVPFDWLFSKVAAVVHHGGLGTTGTALAAGRPQVVCPSFPDQWFNGRQLNSLGVAPEPVGQRRLTVEGLARAIDRAINDERLAVRAEELGAEIRAENGAQTAAEIVRSAAQRSTRPSS